MLELAANAPSPPFRKTPLKGQQHVVNVLDDAVKNGLKVARGCIVAACAAAMLLRAMLPGEPPACDAGTAAGTPLVRTPGGCPAAGDSSLQIIACGAR